MDERFFIRDDFEPAYLSLGTELLERRDRALEAMRNCRLCPRNCEIDRGSNEKRFCKTGRNALVSSAFPHRGEEDCLRGTRGSGTIFFSHCNLRCVFCQNNDISQQGEGAEATAQRIAHLMLDLQQKGCHNINFVSPAHVVPQIIEALALAVPAGLRLPIVYNTGGYDAITTLELLDGIVDIYMPDFKFFEPRSAQTLVKAKDYPEVVCAAVKEMHRQVGVLKMSSGSVAKRGVLIRHLVMPGHLEETKAIFTFLAKEVSKDTFVNIMGQYRPANRVGEMSSGGRSRYLKIDRSPTEQEMEAAYEAAQAAGLWRFDERVSASPLAQMFVHFLSE